MDRPSRRKQRKAKLRADAVRNAKAADAARKLQQRRRDRYPRIRLEGTGKDRDLIAAIQKAIKEIDFDNPKEFTPGEQHFYRLIRSEGGQNTYLAFERALRSFGHESPREAERIRIQLVTNLGERIFQRIPEELRRKYLPYANCQVQFKGNDVVVEYTELCSSKSANGTLFWSPLEPEIEIENCRFKVAFSSHAIQRICERMKEDYTTYGASGDVFGFFAKCVHFQPVSLYPDQPGFLMYDFATTPGLAQYEVYVKKILGEENVDWNGGIPYYRLGYCPVVLEKGFAKAKTFLTPGYKGTPEYGLLAKAFSLSYQEREHLIRLTETVTSIDMLMSGTFEHLAWFHRNGIPQVVQMDREVFKYSNKSKIVRIRDIPSLENRRLEVLGL